MRPLIGVTSLWDDVKSCGWMWQNYLELIWDAGGMPMVLHLNAYPEAIHEAVVRCDGFLVTGGQDLAPSYVDSHYPQYCQKPALIRDAVEFALLMQPATPINRFSAFAAVCSSSTWQWAEH